MKLATKLIRLMNEIVHEIEENPEFAHRVEIILDGGSELPKKSRKRNPALLNPVSIVREHGKDALRQRLNAMDIEELKDIVSEHGMNYKQMVLQWKSSGKIISHIIDSAVSRAEKGSAFLDNEGTR